MDNKLCELSNPVAWKIHNDDHYFLEIREEEAAAYGRMGKKFDPIYSQEYVSALLQRIAELEAKTSMTMGVGDGSGSLFVHGDYDSIKAVQAIIIDNECLRAKLATPVRLQKTNGYWTEQEKAFEDAITLAKRAVRLAGFIVEGDE